MYCASLHNLQKLRVRGTLKTIRLSSLRTADQSQSIGQDSLLIFKLGYFAEERTENESSTSVSFCVTIFSRFAFVLMSLILSFLSFIPLLYNNSNPIPFSHAGVV